MMRGTDEMSGALFSFVDLGWDAVCPPHGGGEESCRKENAVPLVVTDLPPAGRSAHIREITQDDIIEAEAIYKRPRTSQPHPHHPVYPYLLRKIVIDRPNQIWCADITFIPVKRGFLYLVAIMDWATRKVLSWRLSNTMLADFCVEALKDAIARFVPPEIVNTDQGSQFTGSAWITTLTEGGARISMDGRGRCMDNIFIERLWRSLKQEAVYLEEIADGFQARRVISN